MPTPEHLRRPPDRTPLNSAAVTPEKGHDTRISRDDACAILKLARSTFYAQYLGRSRRDDSYVRFNAACDVDTRRLTLSADRVRAHLAEILSDPAWGGPHCPPGAWGRRVRKHAQNVITYRGRMTLTDSVSPLDVASSRVEPRPAANDQTDLFAP